MSRVKSLLDGPSHVRTARPHDRSGSEDGRSGSTTIRDTAWHDTVECPPSSNTGGTVESSTAVMFKRIAEQESVSLVMTETGELKQVMVRRPASGHCAFIDCIRITVGEETWYQTSGLPLVSDDEYIMEASRCLTDILGFGVTKHLQRPRDFYSDSWELGSGFGLVCFGGQTQRGTMLIVIHGSGCLAAKSGWERRLHDFLVKQAKRAGITRIDLAHDCFDGEQVNVDLADRWYDDGGFNCSYKAPSHEYRGNWKRPDGQGRTLYIGKRKNGKLCRVYEKGREQGDSESEWARVEVEFRNTDRIIPFDILLDPSPYFVGAYPCLQLLSSEHSGERLACKQKSAEINVDACIGHIKRTYGKHLKVLRGIFGDEDLLSKVESDSDEWPERLRVSDYTWSDIPIHRRPQTPPFNDFDVSNDGFTTPAFGSTGDPGASCCHFH